MNKDQRSQIIWQAERLERATKAKGRPSGCLGQTGLALLRALLFRFGDAPEPSYKAMRRVTGLAFSTISDAIKRLEAAGIIFKARRTRKTAHGVRIDKNAYRFLNVPKVVPQSLIPADVERRFQKRILAVWDTWESPLKDALDKLGTAILVKQERMLNEGSGCPVTPREIIVSIR
jgi:DNA-binding MarR family transcriptional regulator